MSNHHYKRLVNTLRELGNCNSDLTDEQIIEQYRYYGGNDERGIAIYNSLIIKPPPPIEPNGLCICGQKRVKHFSWIQHKKTLRTVAIGSSCIKRFIPGMTSTVCVFQKLTTNGDWNICGNPVRYAGNYCIQCRKDLQIIKDDIIKKLATTKLDNTFDQLQNDYEQRLMTYILCDKYNVTDLEQQLQYAILEYVIYRWQTIKRMRSMRCSNGQSLSEFMSKQIRTIRYAFDIPNTQDFKDAVSLFNLTRQHNTWKSNNPEYTNIFE